MNEYGSMLVDGDHVIPEYAFILHLGGLDVNHRRCNTHTHTHIMCFEHVAIPYFGLIRESGRYR
jgi:hypothetical protein